MIYTIRTFLVDRPDHARFVELSEGSIWPNLEQQDGYALGLWSVALGGEERILLMTRYESLEHWQGTGTWPEGEVRSARDEELLQRGRAAIRDRSAITHTTDVIALRPISERMPLSDAAEAQPGIYALRTFRVQPRDDAEFVRLSEKVIWPHFGAMGARTLGLWRTLIAERPLLYMLTRYDDLAHWEATRDAGPEPSERAAHAAWQAAAGALRARAALTQESGVRILRPISRRRP